MALGRGSPGFPISTAWSSAVSRNVLLRSAPVAIFFNLAVISKCFVMSVPRIAAMILDLISCYVLKSSESSKPYSVSRCVI